MPLVVELDVAGREPAGALDPDVVRAVDHDLGHAVVGEQPLERAVAEDVVGDLERDPRPVVARDARFLGQLVADVGEDPLAQVVRIHVHVVDLRTEIPDHREVHTALDLGERILVRGNRRRRIEALVQVHQRLRPIKVRPLEAASFAAGWVVEVFA